MKPNSDPIYIVGAGAIGKALAVILTHHGKRVILLRASTNYIPSIKEVLTLRLQNGEIRSAKVNIQTLKAAKLLNGIVLITTKSYVNEQVAQQIASKNKTLPIVLLQNGLGVEKPFVNLGFNSLLRCVLFATSQIGDRGEIYFKPVSSSPVGRLVGQGSTLKSVVKQLDNTLFPFHEEAAILPVIWKKSIINCVFNSICPLLTVDNGVFYREPKALELAKNIIKECVPIAWQVGVHVSEDEIVESLLLISKNADGQFISTLQDLNHGRQTEISTLNLEVANIAQHLGMDTPRITKTLGELILLKSTINLLKP